MNGGFDERQLRQQLEQQIQAVRADYSARIRKSREELLENPVPTKLLPTPQPVMCVECRIRPAAVTAKQTRIDGKWETVYYYTHKIVWNEPGPFCDTCKDKILESRDRYYDGC